MPEQQEMIASYVHAVEAAISTRMKGRGSVYASLCPYTAGFSLYEMCWKQTQATRWLLHVVAYVPEWEERPKTNTRVHLELFFSSTDILPSPEEISHMIILPNRDNK